MAWAAVTGSSSGIGAAAARKLAADGWDVVLHYRRSKGPAEALEAEIRATGRQTYLYAADFMDPEAGPGLVDLVWNSTGGVSLWVHNAGADLLTGPEAKWDLGRKYDVLQRVDLWGTIATCRAAGARMKAAGDGVIVTIGWDQTETGMEGDSGELFAAIKGGVAAFTKSLAKSLAPQVRVHNVAPGWIQTAWGAKASDVWQQRVLRETPLGRWGTPEDVAAAIAFLASPAARMMTGQRLRINGGVVMG
ncbi:MAG TPA: SDR family oxidoreductase [Planctomycetia bacterium]|nr:SDR family oxidoreductase [Planctomycetia bacterium]